MPAKLRTNVLLAFFTLLTAIAHAATLNVGVGQPYRTIQAAIDAAQPGDTVLVAPDTYAESLTISGKSITLKSSAGAARTFLIGSPSGNGFKSILALVQTDLTMVVDGFTIGGGASNTAPFALQIIGSATIQNNSFTNNVATIYQTGGGLALLNNYISTVVPAPAKGICSATGATLNLTLGSTTYGMAPPPTRIANNTIEGDGTACSLAAMTVEQGSQPITIQNNTIRNTAQAISLRLDDGIPAGLISVVSQNLVYNNGGGALSLLVSPHAQLANQGTGPASVVVTNNTFSNNNASTTGYDTFGNPVADISLSEDFAAIGFYNNIVMANSAVSSAINCATQGQGFVNVTPPLFDSNDIFNKQASKAPLFANNCGYSGPSLLTIDGNQSVDPLFVAPTDFHLQPTSPVRDTGNNSAFGLPALDLDNNPRIADTGNLSPIVDPGVYELPGTQDAKVTPITLTISDYDQSAPGPITLTATSSLYNNSQSSYAFNFLQDDIPFYYAAPGMVASNQGVASVQLQPAAPGVYRYTVTYAGSFNNPATGPIAPARSTVVYVYVYGHAARTSTTTITCDPGPVYLNYSSSISAMVTTSDNSEPHGFLEFSENGINLGGGGAFEKNYTQTITPYLPLGTHTILAFANPASASTSTATCTEIVRNGFTSLALTSSLNPSKLGQPVTFTATPNFGPPPANLTNYGTVTFSFNNTILATYQLGGTTNPATLTTSTLPLGADVITATLTPRPGYAVATATLIQQVGNYQAIATLTSPNSTLVAGDLLTATATVASTNPTATFTPTGVVTFYLDGLQIGFPTILVNGIVTQSTGITRFAGTHILTCTYSGDSNFDPTTCAPLTITVTPAPTTTALIATPSTANPGQTVTLSSVTVSNIIKATGNVVFRDGAQILATVPLVAYQQASTSTATFTPGVHILTATYLGDANTLPSTSNPFSLTVLSNSSTTTLTVSPSPAYQGIAVTLLAAITSKLNLPLTASVTFRDGTAILATLPVTNGQATFSTTAFTPGTHLLTAAYAGDPGTPASTSAQIAEVILPSDFTLSSTPGAITLVTGHHTTSTYTAQSVGTFADQLSLSTTGLPPHVTVRFSPTSLSLAPGSQATSSIYLDTDDVTGYLSQTSPADTPATGILAATLLPALALLLRRRRKSLPALLACIVSTTILIAATGCSGKFPASTPPGTYTLNLVATGANTRTTHTLAVPFNVTE